MLVTHDRPVHNERRRGAAPGGPHGLSRPSRGPSAERRRVRDISHAPSVHELEIELRRARKCVVIIGKGHVVHGVEISIDHPQFHESQTLPPAPDLEDGERAALMMDASRRWQLGDGEAEAVAVLELVASPPGRPELLAHRHAVRIIATAEQLQENALERGEGIPGHALTTCLHLVTVRHHGVVRCHGPRRGTLPDGEGTGRTRPWSCPGTGPPLAEVPGGYLPAVMVSDCALLVVWTGDQDVLVTCLEVVVDVYR